MALDLLEYHDGDTALEAAVCRPADRNDAPVVLIVHAWAGRGESEHRIAQRLADAGYAGVAIDVFGKGVSGDPTGDNSHFIGPWLSDRQALLRRLMAAISFARSLEGVDSTRIAAIGYCFGGLCVLDIARSGTPDVAGIVSFHGMLDGNGISSEQPIRAKMLVEHGWLDPLAPPSTVIAFGEEMKARDADWQLHAHGRGMHSFTQRHANRPEKGTAYDVDADRRSWDALIVFLGELFAR